jgi:hypothetical protein
VNTDTLSRIHVKWFSLHLYICVREIPKNLVRNMEERDPMQELGWMDE